jgi:mono/diheme cytochrome c family protein
VNPIEARVFSEEGVIVPDMQAWLRSNNLALLVSRNVTARDRADREQPFNLRVPGGAQTLGTNAGKIYDIAYLQYYQADQLRGLTYGGANPVPGRRVIGVPMHDPAALAFNLPATNAPMGATRLGLDGSQAAFVPARRAMTHQTTDATGQHVVRERYWLTYQPGEIRTCATCHGLNQADQAGRPLPTNAPAALRDLLRYWKRETGYAKILSGVPTGNVFRANITAPPQQTNVLEATSDFMSWAVIGTNFGTTNGLFWLDDSDYTNTPARFYRVKRP